MRINPLNKKAGFTLVELLVVIVIMSLITLVMLNKQSKFDSSTIMRSLTYSIALSVRQAQVYGISVKPTAPTSGNFASSHGLYFDSAVPGSYILFADVNNDNQYNAGDTVDQLLKLNGNFAISEFCAISAAHKRCSGPDGDANTISTMDVMFKRPNPDAIIYAYQTSGMNQVLIPGDLPYSSAYVQIQANDGTKRSIRIYSTGQVSVEPIATAP